MTNGDKIRAISDEELAEILFDECTTHIKPKTFEDMCAETDDCLNCVVKWLKKEVE